MLAATASVAMVIPAGGGVLELSSAAMSAESAVVPASGPWFSGSSPELLPSCDGAVAILAVEL